MVVAARAQRRVSADEVNGAKATFFSIPAADIPSQLSKDSAAIATATGRRPILYRPAGGVSDDAVRAEAAKQGLAEILWDVIPFDWVTDANTAATVYMLKIQIKPGSVVLLHDTYSSTVDVVYRYLSPTVTTW